MAEIQTLGALHDKNQTVSDVCMCVHMCVYELTSCSTQRKESLALVLLLVRSLLGGKMSQSPLAAEPAAVACCIGHL